MTKAQRTPDCRVQVRHNPRTPPRSIILRMIMTMPLAGAPKHYALCTARGTVRPIRPRIPRHLASLHSAAQRCSAVATDERLFRQACIILFREGRWKRRMKWLCIERQHVPSRLSQAGLLHDTRSRLELLIRGPATLLPLQSNKSTRVHACVGHSSKRAESGRNPSTENRK